MLISQLFNPILVSFLLSLAYLRITVVLYHFFCNVGSKSIEIGMLFIYLLLIFIIYILQLYFIIYFVMWDPKVLGLECYNMTCIDDEPSDQKHLVWFC
jgi:hypothetical protein